jgi:hypothetical protein
MSEISQSSKSKILDKISELQSADILNIKEPDEIVKILNLNHSELKAQTSEDLLINAIKLSQYSIYIKSKINKLKSIINWCDANISSIIGRELPNTSGYGLSEKSLVIKRNDPVAKELESVKVNLNITANQIEDIDRKIEFMANSIKALAADRRYNNER